MGSQKKIKVVTLHDDFFKLLSDSDNELLSVRKEMHRKPCLILIKIKYKGKNYTFALPLRSNISNTCPKNTYFSLPPRSTTRDGNHHGIHYVKAFPVDQKFFLPYQMDGDFYGEYILAFIEKNINQIIGEFKTYIENYEMGLKPNFCINIDNAIKNRTYKKILLEYQLTGFLLLNSVIYLKNHLAKSQLDEQL